MLQMLYILMSSQFDFLYKISKLIVLEFNFLREVLRKDPTISFSNLPNGIYTISLSDKRHLLHHQKLIIHH